MGYRVLVAELTELTQRDVLEDALNVAATHMRTSDTAVAVVVDANGGEAETVLHNGFAYLAGPEEAQ